MPKFCHIERAKYPHPNPSLQAEFNARSAFKFKATALKVPTSNADSKNKVKNGAKRFDPSEKIRESGLSFFRGQPR